MIDIIITTFKDYHNIYRKGHRFRIYMELFFEMLNFRFLFLLVLLSFIIRFL